MLMPALNLGTMDTTDILTDGAVTTEDITDTDTLTDTGGRDLPKNNNQNLNILSNDPLMLTLMPMPAPNPGTMDTTAIPTDGAVTTEDITDTDTLSDTGGRDLPKNNNQNLNILSNDLLMLMPMPAPNPNP